MSRILLIEDHEMNRDMLSRRLMRRGHEVMLAIDAEQGMELCKRLLPDIVLMDVSLPGIDGWEATRQLKADPSTRDIPVIALTAYAMQEDRQRASDAGCDDFETKPVEFTRLLAKIEMNVARRRAAG